MAGLSYNSGTVVKSIAAPTPICAPVLSYQRSVRILKASTHWTRMVLMLSPPVGGTMRSRKTASALMVDGTMPMNCACQILSRDPLGTGVNDGKLPEMTAPLLRTGTGSEPVAPEYPAGVTEPVNVAGAWLLTTPANWVAAEPSSIGQCAIGWK